VELRLREMGIADMAIKVIATNAQAIPFYERRGALPFDIQFIRRVEPEPMRDPEHRRNQEGK
jgi:hypothetical protein